MIKINKSLIGIIIIVSIFFVLIISENNKFFINNMDEKFQIKSSYEYTDNITIDNISYRTGNKQDRTGTSKAIISAFNKNDFLWEYYNETYNYSKLRKITYFKGVLYAVGSEYNSKYGTEKLMILSLNSSTGTLNWKYYNNSFKFSRLNTVAISKDTIYCAGYESSNALIISLNLNGTLKTKYLLNDSNISEIENINLKDDSLYCEAKTWDNKNTSLVLPITKLDF